MTREEQLEIALWSVLDLVGGGTTHTDRGTVVTGGLEAVRQGWIVLGPQAQARIEGMLGEVEKS